MTGWGQDGSSQPGRASLAGALEDGPSQGTLTPPFYHKVVMRASVGGAG